MDFRENPPVVMGCLWWSDLIQYKSLTFNYVLLVHGDHNVISFVPLLELGTAALSHYSLTYTAWFCVSASAKMCFA